ncbi:unnamed protein product [Cyclocybe aegerita]|uniref:Uncharacterized protein n=1 Tax=Cyclocybe aegerita TaxID=1973307 RepID=A0A8S0VYU3_CYCAE|nr:unnamed protein product [Cyclocybe aegerita]
MYAAGVEGGYTADVLALIQRQYLKRWPVLLPHEQEQSPDFLAAIDDDVPEEEYAIPSEDKMKAEEYTKAMEEHTEYQHVLTFQKGIKQWMTYQHIKDNDMDPNTLSSNNPYHILMHKLTGIMQKKLRLKTPVNVWRQNHQDEVEAELREMVVVKDLFKKIPQDEKDNCTSLAKQEHVVALTEWERELNAPLSMSPAHRQRCIHGLVQFMQPMIDLVLEATGLMVTVLAGGLEPAHGGTTPGDIKMNFRHMEHTRYKKYIVPIFGSFLQKCFTPEECRSRALPANKPSDEGLDPLDPIYLDAAGVNFDTLPLPTALNTQSLPAAMTKEPVPVPPHPGSPLPAAQVLTSHPSLPTGLNA